MEIRRYEKKDGKKVLSWFDSREEFELWEADRFKRFPINDDELNSYYEKEGIEAYSFIFEGELRGHFAVKPLNEKTARFFLIVLDKTLRGKGLGKRMLTLAMDFVKQRGCDEVSICVFDENEGAVNCYKALGFEYSGEEERKSKGIYREMVKELR